MFSRFAALVIAATIMFHAVPARAFDPAGYHGATAMEILVTGDVTPILEAGSTESKMITLYALSLAGRLQFLWSHRLTAEFGDRAFLKVALVARSAALDNEDLNNLLKLGTADADTFAAQYDFDSETVQKLLGALAMLIVD